MADQGGSENGGETPPQCRWQTGEEKGEKKKKKAASVNVDRRKKKKEEKKEEKKGAESKLKGGPKKKKKDEKEEKKCVNRRAPQTKNEKGKKQKVHNGPPIAAHNSSWTPEEPLQNVSGNKSSLPKNWPEFSIQSPQNLPSSIEMSCLGEIEKAPTVYFLKHLRFHLSQICNRLQERDFRKQMISLKNKAEKETKDVDKKKKGEETKTKGKKTIKENGLKDKNQKKEKNLKEKKEKNLKEKKKKKESVAGLSVDNSYFLLGDVITNQNGRKSPGCYSSPENFQHASAFTPNGTNGGDGNGDGGGYESPGDVGVEISKVNFDRMHSENSPCGFKNKFSNEKKEEESWLALQSGQNDYPDFKPQETYEDISPPLSPSSFSRSSYLSSYIDSSSPDSTYLYPDPMQSRSFLG